MDHSDSGEEGAVLDALARASTPELQAAVSLALHASSAAVKDLPHEGCPSTLDACATSAAAALPTHMEVDGTIPVIPSTVSPTHIGTYGSLCV